VIAVVRFHPSAGGGAVVVRKQEKFATDAHRCTQMHRAERPQLGSSTLLTAIPTKMELRASGLPCSSRISDAAHNVDAARSIDYRVLAVVVYIESPDQRIVCKPSGDGAFGRSRGPPLLTEGHAGFARLRDQNNLSSSSPKFRMFPKPRILPNPSRATVSPNSIRRPGRVPRRAAHRTPGRSVCPGCICVYLCASVAKTPCSAARTNTAAAHPRLIRRP